MNDNNYSTLLENAIFAIELGVEDYKASKEDTKRSLSSIRNIYAGILLLCKEKLRRLSPDDEILIYAKINPEADENGKIRFVKYGNKTVDRDQISERFKNFKLELNHKILLDLSKIRNNVEHLAPEESLSGLRQTISKAFVLIRQIMIIHLGENPSDLIEKTLFNELEQVHGDYQDELAICRETTKSISEECKVKAISEAVSELRCLVCGSELIMQKDKHNDD